MNDKDSFFKLLDVIDYWGDREKLFKTVMETSLQQSLASLFETLEGDEQNRLLDLSEEKLREELKKRFTKEQLEEKTKEILEKNLREYIKRLLPTLTPEQITNLKNSFSRINSKH